MQRPCERTPKEALLERSLREFSARISNRCHLTRGRKLSPCECQARMRVLWRLVESRRTHAEAKARGVA